MAEDEELERIRREKLRRLMRRLAGGAGEKPRRTVLNRPVELNDRTFEEFVRKHPLVVVDLWAPWCAPCRIVSPIIEELARDYAGKIAFGKLNVDENQFTAMQYGVMSIPTLLIFKDGKLVDRIVGAMPRRMLEPRITRHL